MIGELYDMSVRIQHHGGDFTTYSCRREACDILLALVPSDSGYFFPSIVLLVPLISHVCCTDWRCREYLYSLGLRRRTIALTPAIAMAQRRERQDTQEEHERGNANSKQGTPCLSMFVGLIGPYSAEADPRRSAHLFYTHYLSVLVRVYLLALD